MADYWPQWTNGSAAASAAESYDAAEAAATTTTTTTNATANAVGSHNNNNNYVNFNQFIMQHNLGGNGGGGGNGGVGSGSGNGSSSAAGTANALTNIMQHPLGSSGSNASNNYSVGGGGGAFGLTPSTVQSMATSSGFENFYASFPPQLFTPYQNGDLGNSNYNNGAATYSDLYTPFGHNPFAAGFELSASKLQPNAPEFVPNFAKLSLETPATSTAITRNSLVNGNSNNNNSINNNNSNTAGSQETANVNVIETANNANQLPQQQQQQQQQQQHHHQQQRAGATSKLQYRDAHNYTPTDRERDRDRERERERDRDRERDSKPGGSRQRRAFVDYREERDERYERKKPQKQQRYDNHRSNKRRDDWNRNRDRINGYRVDELLDTSNESPLNSPEKQRDQQQQQLSPKRQADNEKLSQREKLVRDIEQRRLECLVCVEPIKAHHAVWSCQNCYHVLHLKCTTTWASSSKAENGWRCPACQNVLQDVPREYYCFCGKLKNPPLTRTELPHSCGELCCRIEGCAHACTLLCHPGPCPPCQANVQRSCGCGKTSKTMQCAMKEEIACGEECGKLLNCEQHTCKEKCHAGKCASCEHKLEQRCHCGKQQREVLCTRETHDRRHYSCSKPCGKDLACGNHKCKDSCHAGNCRPCKLSPEQVSSCPCGKVEVPPKQRTSCLDAVPTCEGVCGKTLRCGKPAHPHQCASKCHLGQCPPCNKQTAVRCRCGHMDQMIKCRQLSTRADDARCKKRCTKKRSCGKHKCNQECCIDIDHACPLPCNRTLSCGKHKCDQPCHRGNCPPCYRSSFDELYCECGAEVIYPPVPCGTKKPACKRPCSRSHPCEHAPQHNCHAAATCPPCMMFTTKWCHGQHEQRKTIPCSQANFSCGLACGKALPCGRHKCIKPCHEGPCQPAAGEICRQSCTTVRSHCGHKCAAPCHDGACPETPCKELVEVQCECGNRKQNRSCHELAREYSRIATAQLASSMAEMSRGNYMELSEILAPVKINKTNRTLDCSDECRVLERNRRLAIGLQIRNPDVQQKLLTKYSDFVRSFAKRNPVLVKSVYETLTDLVKLAKESKQKSRSHSFPTMNREKRQLVHELCEMFGIESVSYDKEPNRNVVATAFKDRSWMPATSIMEVLARESGQRRVPVPSNNAWSLKK
ncbi:protein shuttle craft [Scaptodrosophila lebanonensis]|uniref:Protein shuttle craft n=1 Tax=Drosophila lebanonensis TaxID=7225 RepID=A0A6J2TNQ6_DROLE|nr:protein shuttle craft [Scaptodrosophila lebanonensis]XP_030377680.1 protein shuttle craft [Scaptodrosophila lebanonensis]